MINCTCVVQEGQSPDLHQDVLKGTLGEFSERAFGQGADIKWVRVPPGSGFTAGEPSTSSVVSMVSNEPLEAPHRELLLRELVDLWVGQTGCSVDEIVAVLADPAQA